MGSLTDSSTSAHSVNIVDQEAVIAFQPATVLDEAIAITVKHSRIDGRIRSFDKAVTVQIKSHGNKYSANSPIVS